MTWKLFNEPPTPGTRFVALYSDGSGASVYWYDEQAHLFDATGEDMFGQAVTGQEIENWLFDAGYLYWAALPKGPWNHAVNNGWRRIITDPPKAGTRFVVLLIDSKAAFLFHYSKEKRLFDVTGDSLFGARNATRTTIANYFFDSRLPCWMPLPEEMKLFFEGAGE